MLPRMPPDQAAWVFASSAATWMRWTLLARWLTTQVAAADHRADQHDQAGAGRYHDPLQPLSALLLLAWAPCGSGPRASAACRV